MNLGVQQKWLFEDDSRCTEYLNFLRFRYTATCGVVGIGSVVAPEWLHLEDSSEKSFFQFWCVFDSFILRQRPMSKQPVSKANHKARVSGGVPWWIWGIMAVLGGGIVVALVQRSIPEDPADLFKQALAAADKQDGDTVRAAAEKLSAYPDFATKKKFLDGMLQLGSSRPLKAIVLFKEASEEPEIRTRSLMMLGSAYAQSEDLKRAVETFELALKEDEDSSDARFRLASVYKEMLAFDLSLSYLGVLIKDEYRTAECSRMRGDILFDRRQFAEAATDYEAAIGADKNNPMNSVLAERLIQCLLKVGDLKKAEEYVDLVDQTSARSFFEAEKHLQSGDLAKLGVIVESLQKNATFDPRSYVLYGRRMLKEGTADKAAEGLAGLKAGLRFVTRNAELFQIVADLARVVGDEKLATAAQGNIDQLQALDKEFLNQLAVVSKTQEGYEERLKLAQLSHETGQLDFSSRVYDSMTHAYPDKAPELTQLKEKIYAVLPPLVPLPISAEQESAAPADATGESKEGTNPPALNTETPSPLSEPAQGSEATPATEAK